MKVRIPTGYLSDPRRQRGARPCAHGEMCCVVCDWVNGWSADDLLEMSREQFARVTAGWTMPYSRYFEARRTR